MSRDATPTTLTRRAGSLGGRVARAWRILPHERRLAAYASLGLFVALFLPWYQETVFVTGAAARLQSATVSLTGWGAFSFVEAAVLLVAVGVLILLFQRAEGRAFHIPGGDGGVIMAAGAWTCVLVVWRIFDKQSAGGRSGVITSSGIEWGIFVALAVAAFLVYAGSRIRAAHRPEPPLPGEKAAVVPGGGPLSPAGPPRAAAEPVPVTARVIERAPVRGPERAPEPAPARLPDAEPAPVPAPARRPAIPAESSANPYPAARRAVPAAAADPAEDETIRVPGQRGHGWLSAKPSHLGRDDGEEDDETIRLERPE